MRNIIFGLALAVCQVAVCETAAATNAPAMEVRYYLFEQTGYGCRFYSRAEREKPIEEMAKEEESGWHAFFMPFGVTWPKGSSVAHVGAICKLRVRNTSENHAKIAAALDELRRETEKAGSQKSIEIAVRLVEVGPKALDELGAQFAAKKPAGAHYDLGDFADVDAAALERALAGRRDLVRNHPLRIVTPNGAEAVVKRVDEYIYPTDYDVMISGPTNAPHWAAVEPQQFTMREAGVILDVTPDTPYGSETIHLRLGAQIVDDPEWRDYGMKYPAPNGAYYDLPMEQPTFRAQTINVDLIKLTPGKTVLASGAASKGKDGEDRTLLCFVRAREIDAKASSK